MLAFVPFLWISIAFPPVGVLGYSSLITIGAIERSASSLLKESEQSATFVKHTAAWGEDIGVDIVWSLTKDDNCFTVIKEAIRLSTSTDLLIFADEFSICVGHGLMQYGISIPVLFYKGRQSIKQIPTRKSSLFPGFLMCGFPDVLDDFENTERCEMNLDGPIQAERSITISKVETLVVVLKELKWKHIFLFYETNTEKEAQLLTDSLSSFSINMVMYNLDDFHNATELQTLLTTTTIHERQMARFVVLSSSETAKGILSVADDIDIIRRHKEVSFSMESQWLIILPEDNRTSIEACVTDLDHVAIIIYPPDNYIFIHEMTMGLPLSIEEILRKVGVYNYTSDVEFEVLQNETQDLFIKYFTNPLSCWHSDIHTLLWKPDGRKFNYVGFVNITGEIYLKHKIFPNLDYGLNKRKFTVSTVPWDPFVKVKGSGYEGFCIDVLDELSMALNFTYEMVDGPEDREWGMLTRNGSWTGLIGQLEREEVDLVAAPITSSPDREEVMDFIFPFYYDSLSVLIRKPDPSSTKWRTMIDPFRWEVLMCIGISLIGSSVVLFLLEKWNPFYSREPYLQRYAGTHIFQDAFWYMYGAMLTQGGEHLPDSQTGRTMISAWWLFSIIMAATYSGNLIAFLTVTKDKAPFDTLLQLVAQDEFHWGLPSGTKMQMDFEFSSNGIFQQVWRGITNDFASNPDVLSPNISTHFAMVDQGNYALISDTGTLKIPLLTNCDLYIMKETFMSVQYGFGLTNRSAYTEVMSKKMLSIYESGLLQMWQSKWWASKRFCVGALQTKSKPISLVDVQSSFYLIGVGLALAAIALGIEHCFLKFVSCKKPHPVTVISNKNKHDSSNGNLKTENGHANGFALHIIDTGEIPQDENDNITLDEDSGFSYGTDFLY